MNKSTDKLKQLLTPEEMAEFTIEYNALFNAKEQRLLLKARLNNIVNAAIITGMPNSHPL
jgi:hypothetical protein